MIKRISLENFKCFEQLNMEFSNLNVFAGVNSMGKSTVIQSLLLLRQSYDMNALDKGIYLNGDLTSLGTGYDLMYRFSDKDSISISIDNENDCFKWEYKYLKDSDYLELINDLDYDFKFPFCNLFSDRFSYVSADRIGPQRYYLSSYYDAYKEKKVGTQGELFASYLAERGKEDKVMDELILERADNSKNLVNQTASWLSLITPGIEIDTKKLTSAGLVGVEYKVDQEIYSPMNVGFGISYSAPIIVALLKAQKGDLVVLENPEAHLHPKGQRKMGELISRAASVGVQILLETHSDHLLNGIRLSVKKNVIDRKKIRLNYFYTRKIDINKSTSRVVHEKCTPCILDNGSLSDWPDGFFDEWDKALEELI